MRKIWNEEDYDTVDSGYIVRFISREELINKLLDRISEEGKMSEEVENFLTDLANGLHCHYK